MNSVLDSDNTALLPLSQTQPYAYIRIPQSTEFSVLSAAVSCEGLEADPREYSQRGGGEEGRASIHLPSLSSLPVALFSLSLPLLSLSVSHGLFGSNVRCKGHSHHATVLYHSVAL